MHPIWDDIVLLHSLISLCNSSTYRYKNTTFWIHTILPIGMVWTLTTSIQNHWFKHTHIRAKLMALYTTQINDQQLIQRIDFDIHPWQSWMQVLTIKRNWTTNCNASIIHLCYLKTKMRSTQARNKPHLINFNYGCKFRNGIEFPIKKQSTTPILWNLHCPKWAVFSKQYNQFPSQVVWTQKSQCVETYQIPNDQGWKW